MLQKKKIIIITLSLIIGVVGVAGYFGYKIFAPNVNTASNKLIYIPTGATQGDVLELLKKQKCIGNIGNLEWVMQQKSYAKKVRPGRFLLKNGMSNNDLVNMLRSGKQDAVALTFNNTRTLEDFAGKIAKQIEPDSLMLLNALKNDSLIAKMGFMPSTIIAMFIPNTYEIYWNTQPTAFFKRMHKEYRKFWNKNRLNKARQIGLTPIQVATLASIVDEETMKNSEKPRVAGVYINRLNKNIKLDADPTLKFALGDFSIKRVLNKHKRIDSPYNTYKYAGLPPGPIRQPSISGLKAVLNYEKHNYYYFCAKADFSGYHAFARTLRQHNKNARKYQRALNKLKIWK